MSDFASGASVGFQIQQRLLAKKLREIDDKRYEDEKLYKRWRDATGDTQWQKEQETRATEVQSRREAAAADRALRERELGMTEKEYARKQAVANAMRSNDMMDQLGNALKTGLDARKRRAEAALLEQRLADSGGYTVTEDIDPDTGRVNSVRRTSRGSGAAPQFGGGTAGAALTPDPVKTAEDAAATRLELDGLNAKVAAGDNHWGPEFLGMGKDRRVQAAGLQAKLDNLGQVERDLRASQRMAGMPAGIQAQFAQTGQQGGAPQAPGAPQAQITPPDPQAALAWAKANPNDPRSAAILKRLGVQ